jgi:hypothetical protein
MTEGYMFTKDELFELEELARTNPLIAKLKDEYHVIEKDLSDADYKINGLQEELQKTHELLVNLQNCVIDIAVEIKKEK